MALPFSVRPPLTPRKLTAQDEAARRRTVEAIRARQLQTSTRARRRKPSRRMGRLVPLPQPDALRRQYTSALVAIMAIAHKVAWAAIKDDRAAIEAAAAGNRRADAAPAITLGRAAQLFLDLMPNSELARAARRFGEMTSAYHKGRIVEQFRQAVGVDLFAGRAEPWLPGAIDRFTEANVGLIRKLSSSHFDDLRNHLTEAITDGRRWEQIASEIQERMDISDRHAELIARDQVGKFYGSLNETRQVELGVERYTWRGVRDNRERDEHWKREGHSFRWDDPPEGGHPGEDINCRCSAEPDLAALLEKIG